MTPTQGERAQTALAHELFAAAQLAPGEGIEDAVSRIAAALTAAPSVSDGQRALHESILNRLSHAELLEKAHYLMELNSNQARTIGELQDLVETAPAQPAAPQGGAYAELPPRSELGMGLMYEPVEGFTADDMRSYADATHALRVASNGQAPAAFQRALDIRAAQGWKLGGNKVPVLYTDSINGEQVSRDDIWLCTTAAFATPPTQAADSVLEDAARLEFEMQHGSAIDAARKQGAKHD